MKSPTLGDQELDLLRYISESGAVTVGEVVEGYGQPHQLSRSTVVTVMERLRNKGYLKRSKQDGVFRYSCPIAPDEVVGGLIQRFVEKTLAGSLLPFAAYFARSERLSDTERAELERLIAKLEVPTPTTGKEPEQ